MEFFGISGPPTLAVTLWDALLSRKYFLAIILIGGATKACGENAPPSPADFQNLLVAADRGGNNY